ncbi:MAG: amino acid ABC transporter substrate-binding protein [Oscillospiraceae bacterium]|nr:amino acid ABC transporter substrate-binding protein [Oscillospiraceae bacterium]
MNLKKLAIVALAGVLSLSMFAGCGSETEENTESAEDTSLADVQEKGYFTIGLDADFAPMGFTQDDGTIVGFDIDLANAVAEKMGVSVEVKPIDWDSKSMELSTGKIDVIWNGFSITDERRQEVLFSNPYLSTKQSIIVKAGSDITTKADLAGKKIALQDGSTSEDALKADTATYETIGDENISRFKENSQVLMEVNTGRADAAVIDEVFVRYYLQKENMLDQYTVLEEGFDEEDYGVGGRLGDYSLMEAINKALDECKEDGTTSEISIKWFGEDLVK